MAFGSRHCWGIALLILVITQVMLTTAYQDEHTYSSSRSRVNDGYGGHDDINRHDRDGGHLRSHNSKEHHEHEYSHEESAATTVRAMFQTTMLVGTSLMLYWI